MQGGLEHPGEHRGRVQRRDELHGRRQGRVLRRHRLFDPGERCQVPAHALPAGMRAQHAPACVAWPAHCGCARVAAAKRAQVWLQRRGQAAYAVRAAAIRRDSVPSLACALAPPCAGTCARRGEGRGLEAGPQRNRACSGGWCGGCCCAARTLRCTQDQGLSRVRATSSASCPRARPPGQQRPCGSTGCQRCLVRTVSVRTPSESVPGVSACVEG